MRKFKFRAHIAGHGMTKPFRLKELMRGEVIYSSDGVGILKPDDTMVKIMQFTGLTDKNGVEIYESDIVKFGDNPIHGNTYCKVEYSSKRGQYIYIFLDGQYKDKCTDMHDEWRSYTVIGNIYQNPEFMEK